MFNAAGESKITNAALSDIMLILPDNQASINTPSVTNVGVNNSIDVRALSLNIVLLKMKKTYMNRLATVVANEFANEQERKADIAYLARNITIIDKYLKNVLLKLRLRYERDFGWLMRRRQHPQALRASPGQTDGGRPERVGYQQTTLAGLRTQAYL